eukprot:CAMPEP_0204186302 /NCGR_PEP_ID=MMETSP0361-20130328/55890_1 /ASSEMBLY_ACC=CAM_ASM_000343 /TAXON_ID=268821 /ORGANISM="Scrippsiella Hangoei, Strain SHTV-5" /LENGTH=57 /DNA_ID=CAMNT_0051146583 /DNA_START=464 /DNA_END=634 /DNA_ORIENTATION=-
MKTTGNISASSTSSFPAVLLNGQPPNLVIGEVVATSATSSSASESSPPCRAAARHHR